MLSQETNRIILAPKRLNTLLPLYNSYFEPYSIKVVVIKEDVVTLPMNKNKVNNKLYSPFTGAKAPKLKNSFDNFTL